MCAITGYLERTGDGGLAIGKLLLRMLLAVGCRGPDSTGVAVYGREQDGFVLRIKLGESGDFAARAPAHPTLQTVRVRRSAQRREDGLTAMVERLTPIREAQSVGSYLRLVVADLPETLIPAIEAFAPEVEVVSAGRRLEIVKQVGSPEELEATYHVSRFVGTHGIGHTRLSTESRIDLSHSQPFWAHGLPDVATAHNGHITNYHKLRRIYEQRGVRFHTENDSEIIGVYLRDRMARGDSFEEALRASLSDFDGSFCYVAATENALAYVKDPFGLKPLVVAETEDWVAVATEEIALRAALGTDFRTREPAVRGLQVWQLPQRVPVAA
jgi:glutamine phosphoribosylpyrophosphate amidotransferase